MSFRPRFASATPEGRVGPIVGFAGEVFDRRGRRLPPGADVTAFIGSTRCAVATTRVIENFTGFSIDVVGPESIPRMRARRNHHVRGRRPRRERDRTQRAGAVALTQPHAAMNPPAPGSNPQNQAWEPSLGRIVDGRVGAPGGRTISKNCRAPANQDSTFSVSWYRSVLGGEIPAGNPLALSTELFSGEGRIMSLGGITNYARSIHRRTSQPHHSWRRATL